MPTPVVVLASSSPRRKELLKKLFDEYLIRIPAVDESVCETEPERIASAIAAKKGRAVTEGDVVIACDTIVVSPEGKIFGKPHGREEAASMLAALSGKAHEVISGLYVRIDKKERICFEKSTVFFRDLTAEDIEKYIDGYCVYDKAGAYAIQDGQVVEHFEGSYDNIVGLPTEKLEKILHEEGILCRK